MWERRVFGKVKQYEQDSEDKQLKELLDEIESYWSTRTEGYSEVNQKELHGLQKKAWLSVLEKEFPKKPKADIRILDIGTGPGFFPMILAEAGYHVDAVDYTEGMLEKAKENAGALCENICFQRMDAQMLTFPDETFDVVISRNLTWNLPEPEKAYKEWYRVLKKGGKMLNFDANWYGYLYDEEKRKAYENDRKNVEEKSLDDHYLCTDIDRMEQIALQVPLSAIRRPKWDIEVLKKTGFENIFTDETIWEKVWSEEEKLNYQSTPMFMIKAVKTDIFSIGGLSTAPGERVHGFITIGNGEFSLPATIIRGKECGKTALITAGVHAGEYVGIQSAVELGRDLKIEKMTGTVIIVKVLNREEFENRRGSAGQSEIGNLNRVFPGEKDGDKLSRLAYAVVKELQERVDYYIDLHSGDDYEELAPYVYYAGKADPEVVKISRRMAEQVDVPYMVKSEVASGGSYNYAASQGIPSILLERGGMGTWDSEEVRSMKRDVRSVLRYLGIYDGHKSYRKYYPLDVRDVQYQSAADFGLWYPRKKVGDLFASGEILGYVKDYEDKVKETCCAYYDGVILYQYASLQVTKDGPMIAYGRIAYEEDDRKERITTYWTKRSDSFLEQRRAELHSPLSGRWMEEIRKYLPSDRKLRVLDVGCGTGFFTILLAKEGHHVTGIDLTPDMISHARRLAKEEQADCDFQVMDAEHLSFNDGEFDVIISRNLTWTLPEAAQAYMDWSRVLKPGGVLLNFDANYGASDFSDTKDLPENHAHHQIEDELMHECEEIKRQLPISSYIRPAWDLETLSRVGMEQFSIDLGISSRIYVERDEFYNPTPMFAVCARKIK